MAEATQFKKGKPRGPGRPKGMQNKTTVALKTAIMNAFTKVGGEDYLVKVAREDPKTFCTLLGRVLPSELKADLSSSDGSIKPVHIVLSGVMPDELDSED